MTKFAGLEGTVIIATEHAEIAKRLGVYERAVARAKDISVLREAAIAAELASAMHDITEGGVLGACYEMAEASQIGVLLELDEVPVLDETEILCREFGLNPYALISSGCLLIAASDGERLTARLNEANIPARVIGRFTERGKEYRRHGVLYELPEPAGDEIYKIGG
jgi:hydrogenase maturation factor